MTTTAPSPIQVSRALIQTHQLRGPGSYGVDIDVHEDPRRALSGFINQYGKSQGWKRYRAEVDRANEELESHGHSIPNTANFRWEISVRDPISGFSVTKSIGISFSPHSVLRRMIKQGGYGNHENRILRSLSGTAWWNLA